MEIKEQPKVIVDSKAYGWGFIIIPFTLLAVVFSMIVMAMGCAWGGGGVACRISGLLLAPYILGSLAFLIIFILLSKSTKRESTRLPLLLIIIFILLSLLVVIVPRSLSEGGVLGMLIDNTQLECDIKSSYGKANCYKELALTKNNIGYCENAFSEQILYRTCRSQFAINEKDESLCVKGDTVCFREVALAQEDPASCEMIEENMARTYCLTAVAAVSLDLAIAQEACDASDIGGESCMQTFLLELSRQTEDVKYCDYWPENSAFKSSCVRGLAVMKADPRLCNTLINLNTVDDGALRAMCFLDVAIENKNIDFCQYIPRDYPQMVSTCQNMD
jgi:hypothetical protein